MNLLPLEMDLLSWEMILLSLENNSIILENNSFNLTLAIHRPCITRTSVSQGRPCDTLVITRMNIDLFHMDNEYIILENESIILGK